MSKDPRSQHKKLRNKKVHLVRVLWKNSHLEEETWERESEIRRKKYPSLFSDAGMNLNFEDKILLGGENLNPRKLKKYNKW